MSRTNPSLIHYDTSKSWKNSHIRALAPGRTTIHSRFKLGQQECTDDRIYSQNDLSCEVSILSNNNDRSSNHLYSSTNQQTDRYVILNSNDQRTKTSPFLIGLSLLLGACIVLSLAFFLHWLFNFYYRKKNKDQSRRPRNSTHSGAEEVNHDWIFLDRNSLEMPIKQQQQQPQQQENSPSIHSSSLHITSNPLINTSTLKQQQELSELSHSQMIAYFENLKESHA